MVTKFLAVLALAAALAAPLAARAQQSEAPAAAGGQPAAESAATAAPTERPNSDIWRALKEGAAGTVSIPDKKAAVLIQREGEYWRERHNGAIPRYGAWAMLGVVVLLALFFALTGRVRIREGRAGVTITRFTALERGGHWLTATSFVVLALTGLNVLYGRSVLLPLIGPEAFAAISQWGKYIHNYVAFAFIAGLVFLFVHWVALNIPNRHDLVWLAKGGGIIRKDVHVPARKFNAGQKIIFWLTILGGASVALSGWALLFPFDTRFMTVTMEGLQSVGLDVPAWFGLPNPPYSPVLEQQLNQMWHAIMALFLTVVIIGHIYIGTLGMEGAFDAMATGEVDLNWAREHHDLWVRELEERLGEDAARQGGRVVPAE